MNQRLTVIFQDEHLEAGAYTNQALTSVEPRPNSVKTTCV